MEENVENCTHPVAFNLRTSESEFIDLRPAESKDFLIRSHFFL